jgi:ATP-dependent protease Clp ATPase subunit
MKSKGKRVCSFCGQHESDDLRLLYGPGEQIAICEECVTFSAKIDSKQASNSQLEGSCSFCGKSASQVERLVYGPGTNICNKCIDFAQEQLGGGGPSVKDEMVSQESGLVAGLKKLFSGNRSKTDMTRAG